MRKYLLVILLLCQSTLNVWAKDTSKVFQGGEHLKFKISYGLLNAGIATLDLTQTTYQGQKLLHAQGIGYTTGVPKVFFKVHDDYQSYFTSSGVIPYRFIRKIDEGGYTKDQEGFFNYSNNTVLVKDYKKETENTYPIHKGVQDIVSAFYYLRSVPTLDDLNVGESVEIAMFFDGETFDFKLELLAREDLKTKFGRVKSLKFRPYVLAGRVFKAKESLTVWVSADQNKVPLKIKASLAVGSLKAELDHYSGLVHDLQIEVK